MKKLGKKLITKYSPYFIGRCLLISYACVEYMEENRTIHWGNYFYYYSRTVLVNPTLRLVLYSSSAV